MLLGGALTAAGVAVYAAALGVQSSALSHSEAAVGSHYWMVPESFLRVRPTGRASYHRGFGTGREGLVRCDGNADGNDRDPCLPSAPGQPLLSRGNVG